MVTALVGSLSDACREQGCTLTGGETSEQPGVLDVGTYVITASVLGVAERRHVLDGSAIVTGDVVMALPSSGVHTNGFTLIRTLLTDLPDAVQDVTVLADGDEAGEAAARECAWRWKREGRRVRIARPPRGLDFNDLLMGRGPDFREGAA